jgi:hypothetical protein
VTETARKQHVILCEGFDDRSFWAGWLGYLGCTDPSKQGRVKVKDAHGLPVQGSGRFLFHPRAGACIILHPYGGRSKLRGAANEYLKDHKTHPIDRMIFNLDSDAESGSEDTARDVIRGIAAHFGSEVENPGTGTFDLDGIRTSAVIWQCADEDAPGVPRKQTLERLVAASIRAAYPARGSAVEEWLAAEPKAEAAVTGKNYGYSYLAKWYAQHGADDFFRALWRDEAVVEQLRRRIEADGAWAMVQDLVAE